MGSADEYGTITTPFDHASACARYTTAYAAAGTAATATCDVTAGSRYCATADWSVLSRPPRSREIGQSP